MKVKELKALLETYDPEVLVAIHTPNGDYPASLEATNDLNEGIGWSFCLVGKERFNYERPTNLPIPMDPKIKKLAEDCGFYFYDMTDIDSQNLGYSVEADSFEAVNKLVEAVVRECAKVARSTDLEDVEGGDSEVLQAATLQILKHFGIT